MISETGTDSTVELLTKIAGLPLDQMLPAVDIMVLYRFFVTKHEGSCDQEVKAEWFYALFA